MKLITPLVVAILLIACALPNTGVHTGSIKPTIYVRGASEGEQLYVNGLLMGTATQFNGDPNVLIIEEGANLVEIKRDGLTLHSEKIFISDGESKAITLNTGVH